MSSGYYRLLAATIITLAVSAPALAEGFVTRYGVEPVIHTTPPPLVPEAQVERLQVTTHFALDRSRISPQDDGELTRLVATVEQLRPSYGMGRDGYLVNGEIIGYTDNVGSNSYNDALSRQRALAVQSYLEGLGADTGQFTVYGMGKRQPVADNSTADGRALNRRTEVDLKLLVKPQ